jgi:hypothetical protein
MRKIALVIGLSLAASTGAALAQGAPRVQVSIGPQLERKAGDYGRDELQGLREDLSKEIERTLARRGSQIASVALTIEDAQPNRPTMEEMGRIPGLSMRSIGVGGARISGVVTFADGHTQPIRYQWYETDLRNEIAANTWSDAERSFMFLADDLGAGRVPDAYRGAGPSENSGFGRPWRGE